MYNPHGEWFTGTDLDRYFKAVSASPGRSSEWLINNTDLKEAYRGAGIPT
jgi:hypothetical protein